MAPSEDSLICGLGPCRHKHTFLQTWGDAKVLKKNPKIKTQNQSREQLNAHAQITVLPMQLSAQGEGRRGDEEQKLLPALHQPAKVKV